MDNVHILTHTPLMVNVPVHEEQSTEDLGPPLCALCTSGDISAVKEHLKKPDSDVNMTDSTGETPLHKACNTGDLKVLELLLKQDGIKISPKSDNGETPLHIASKRGNPEAARLLLDADAEPDEADQCNIDMPDSKGLTPLCYATKLLHQRRDVMVKFLLERYFVVGQ